MTVSLTDNSKSDSEATTPVAKLETTKSHSQWYFIWQQFKRDKAAIVGGVILLVIIISTFISPFITPYDPLIQSDNADDRLAPPSLEHPMGTDDLRRDLFSRVLSGGRTTISVGVISISVASFIGMIFGLLAGYFGGYLDQTISRLIDIVLTLPGILLAIVIVAILGPGLQNAMIAVAISSIPSFARLVRSETLVEKNKVYVDSSKALGGKDLQIMFRHILPNVIQSVIVVGTLRVATAIQIAAGLSFLGLGAQPPNPEWGAMLSNGRNYMRTGEWWMTVFPGLAIFITIMAINLVGDGLRDALDPRLRGDK